MCGRKLLSAAIISLLTVFSTGCNRSSVLQADPSSALQQLPSAGSVSPQSQGMSLQEEQNMPPSGNLNYQNTAPQAPVNVNPNLFEKKLRVDHDVLNQWQATGVVAAGGTVYFAAVDKSGLLSKGTVIKVQPTGNAWTDLGGSLFSFRHSMSSGLQGITYINGSLLVIDSQNTVYKIVGSKVSKMSHSGGKDITAAGNSVFIVNNSGMIEKTDENLSSNITLRDVIATGGIGGDLAGNLYIVSNKEIIKVDSTGNIIPLIKTNLDTPVDVTADSQGNVYVLDGNFFKRFDSNGNYLVTVPVQGTKPNSIHADEAGKIYISTHGSNYKDSSVEVFAAGQFYNAQPSASLQTSNGIPQQYNSYQAMMR